MKRNNSSRARLSVLIVDGDAETKEVLSRFLDDYFRVLTASTAQESFGTLKSEQIDLVLLELLIPDIGGLTILRQIKDDPRTAKIPVIVVTAWDDPKVLAETKRLGAAEYLIKPVFRRQLLRSVRARLRNRSEPT